MKKIVLPGLLAGVLMLVVGTAVTYSFQLLFPGIGAEYNNAALFRPWADPLMTLFFLYPFMLGIILAWFWAKAKHLFKDPNHWMRGIHFGLAFFFIGIPGMFMSYTSFAISLGMALSWMIGGLCNGIVAGWTFARMNP